MFELTKADALLSGTAEQNSQTVAASDAQRHGQFRSSFRRHNTSVYPYYHPTLHQTFHPTYKRPWISIVRRRSLTRKHLPDTVNLCAKNRVEYSLCFLPA